MKIVITGTRSLSKALEQALTSEHDVVCLDRGYDIAQIDQWYQQFNLYDCVINSAHDKFGQVGVLEYFSNMWKDCPDKRIINIGSIVTDYARSERDKEADYFSYRIHKQALQLAFSKLSRESKCCIQLINPGPFDSETVAHISVPKLTQSQVCDTVKLLINNPNIKRIDQWI